jgi:hypothetical protein
MRPGEPAPPAHEADVKDELAASLRLAFAPLHKRAFGTAIGTAVGLALLLATVASLLLEPAGRLDLSLLAQFFAAYSVSWTGALIGAGWGFLAGFVYMFVIDYGYGYGYGYGLGRLGGEVYNRVPGFPS